MIFRINLDLKNIDINRLNTTLKYIDDNINDIIKNNHNIKIWENSYAIYDLKINDFTINIHYENVKSTIKNISIQIN